MSVVLAALLAAAFLRERVGVERLAGAVAVAGGVALIALDLAEEVMTTPVGGSR